MNLHTLSLCALPLVLASAIAACAPRDDSGPPDIRLGRDECAHCGMIIDDDRSSSATIFFENGHAAPALFDDIGDMLDYEQEHPAAVVKQRYVHDYESRSWRTAPECTYVWCEKLRTPMGSGLAAFAHPADAQKLAAGSNDRVMSFQQLQAFRSQWRRDRHRD